MLLFFDKKGKEMKKDSAKNFGCGTYVGLEGGPTVAFVGSDSRFADSNEPLIKEKIIRGRTVPKAVPVQCNPKPPISGDNPAAIARFYAENNPRGRDFRPSGGTVRVLH